MMRRHQSSFCLYAILGLLVLASTLHSREATAQSNSELQAFLGTVQGMETVCRHGMTSEQGSSDAASFCNGRLEGVARIMQYNCISLDGGAAPNGTLVMGDFLDVENLRNVFITFSEAADDSQSREWSLLAAEAFSLAFHCKR